MSGGVGFRLPWTVREAVGIFPSAERLVLVHLCAADDALAMWAVAESRIVEADGRDLSEPKVLASCARAELVRAGWEKLPLGLVLPHEEAEITERELPVLLAGEELREALLWSLHAEGTADAERDICLCGTPLVGTMPQRYWTARVDAARIRTYFSAFAAAGLCLHRMTVCPPNGGALADAVETAREPRMPWESASETDDLLPAIYAGLLLRADTPVHLYWTGEKPLLGRMRAHAAALIAVLATAVFLGCAAADAAAYLVERTARDQAVEELTLRSSERARMEEFYALRTDLAERERLLSAFLSESLPVRALLVHLGTAAVDGVRLTGIHADAQNVRIEGVASDYAALSALIGALEEDAFFSAEVTLEYAEQEKTVDGTLEQIRFVLHSRW